MQYILNLNMEETSKVKATSPLKKMDLGQKKYVLRPKDTPVRFRTKQRSFSGPSGALTSSAPHLEGQKFRSNHIHQIFLNHSSDLSPRALRPRPKARSHARMVGTICEPNVARVRSRFRTS